VVHRERAHDQIERAVGERQGRCVADREGRLVRVGYCHPAGIGSGAFDHRRIEVEPRHVQSMPTREGDRQVAGPTADFEDAGSFGDDGRNVGGDAPKEWAQQQSAERVVPGHIPDEDPAGHRMPSVVTTAMPKDGCDRRRGGDENPEHDDRRSTHW
jgi:hypothetical protein